MGSVGVLGTHDAGCSSVITSEPDASADLLVTPMHTNELPGQQ